MPIIGSEPLQKNYYRLSITMGAGIIDNVLIAPDGLYSVYFIQEGRYLNATGKIPKIVMDYRNPQNSYLLFDYSCDSSARRERVYFYQVQMIKDITPNNAYRIAVEHGYDGTVEQWLESLKGQPGMSAYEIAVECGFRGTKEEWIKSLHGKDEYEIAQDYGFTGTREQWIASLHGKNGKDAFELAQERGYTGTIEEWFAQFGDVSIMQTEVNQVKNNLTWIVGMQS